jgi:hypothetical protein
VKNFSGVAGLIIKRKLRRGEFMNRMSFKFLLRLMLATAVLFLTAGGAFGTELYIPEMKAKPGDSIKVPVMLDRVDNLAGIKMVMKYDTNFLTFKKAGKTKHTSSLMHIVNDKKPGFLVVVMAGAKGIKGEAFPIILIQFEVKKELKGDQKTTFEITELQLMSDDLKDLKYTIKASPLMISGGSAENKGQAAAQKSDQKAETSNKETAASAEKDKKASSECAKGGSEDVKAASSVDQTSKEGGQKDTKDASDQNAPKIGPDDQKSE